MVIIGPKRYNSVVTVITSQFVFKVLMNSERWRQLYVIVGHRDIDIIPIREKESP